MVQDDPSKRPTMGQAVERFDSIRQNLSTWKLRSRVTARDEGPFEHMYHGAAHWRRRIGFIVKRVSAIPRLPQWSAPLRFRSAPHWHSYDHKHMKSRDIEWADEFSVCNYLCIERLLIMYTANGWQWGKSLVATQTSIPLTIFLSSALQFPHISFLLPARRWSWDCNIYPCVTWIYAIAWTRGV